MNPENLKKHLIAVEGGLANHLINLLKNTLAEANAKIEELEKELAELKKPKEEPKS